MTAFYFGYGSVSHNLPRQSRQSPAVVGDQWEQQKRHGQSGQLIIHADRCKNSIWWIFYVLWRTVEVQRILFARFATFSHKTMEWTNRFWSYLHTTKLCHNDKVGKRNWKKGEKNVKAQQHWAFFFPIDTHFLHTHTCARTDMWAIIQCIHSMRHACAYTLYIYFEERSSISALRQIAALQQ